MLYCRFILKYTLAHIPTYLFFGILGYTFVNHDFYIGSEPVFASFLVTPNQPELWNSARIWMIPAQFLRALIIGSTMFLIRESLFQSSFYQRTFIVFCIYSLVGGLASDVPAPGTIEGLVYMLPNIEFSVHFIVLTEVVLQGFISSLIFSYLINKDKFLNA
ncbi:hypothetical protein [Leptospira sp. GIMC2001]|uniref:hypothetical protein n=1 Tax=Leptospira sp. GIMC2001 TaxID=1513297 RepID=UPI00234A6C38|nr:hypothetical protein [Leptospira sp. GIMC2001]WCL49367.1 hypothetical protein O4O04_19070 [Leptospira sp. GIMC2001]